MKKLLLVNGLAAVAVIGIVASAIVTAEAATSRYAFTARGIITAVDKNNKTIKVDVTKAPGKAQDDLEGENKEFKLDDAKFYQNTAGKDKRVTIGALKIGQEIGFKGTAQTDDTYRLNFVRIHDRAFVVVGLIKEHDLSARTMKILITTSTYKSAAYNGKEVTMKYNDDSKFKNSTAAITQDSVKADDQKVQVIGTLTGSNTWEIKNFFNRYKGK